MVEFMVVRPPTRSTKSACSGHEISHIVSAMEQATKQSPPHRGQWRPRPEEGPTTVRGIYEEDQRTKRRRRKGRDTRKSQQANGALLPDVDERSAWVRRAREVIADHLSDVPDASVAERSLLRRAAIMT